MSSTWGPDLFRGTAWYYARYRWRYPQPFFDHIVQRFGLDGTGRLLDLGCGPGTLAIPFAKHFDEVVALDPEPEMLAEGKRLAAEDGVKNIHWVEGGSHDLSESLGSFRLVTIGAAFHWMNRHEVIENLHKLVVADGGVVIVDSGAASDTSNAWNKAVQAVICRWLGERRRAGTSYYEHPKERYEDIVARSSFSGPEIWRHQYLPKTSVDIDGIIGNLYSTSYCSPAVLGEKKGPFERDLRETLLKLEPSGVFKGQPATVEAIMAWKDA
jgi:ubiquinone/menaquinone biosynthesis C-methylase UbiE